MKTLTAKAVRLAIKRHVPIEVLAKEHGLDITALEKKIRVLFGNDAIKIINKLQRFSKKSRKNTENQTDSQPLTIKDDTSRENTLEVEKVPSSDESSEFSSIVDESENCSKVPTSIIWTCTTDSIKQLASLFAKTERVSNLICDLEDQHRLCVAERDKTRKSLLGIRNALNELKRLVEENQEKVQQKLKAYNLAHEEMQGIQAQITENQNLLSVIRRQIQDVKVAFICVYKDHLEVEYFDTLTPEIDDSEVAKYYTSLTFSPMAEELTIKEVKTIAQLLVLLDYFKANDIKYELIFDNASCQDLFNSISQ